MSHFKIIISFIIVFNSCTNDTDIDNNPCQNTVDISSSTKMQTIVYSSATNVLIDINNDGVDDFNFVSELAGNRYARVLKSVNNQNKLVDAPFLEGGTTINEESSFVNKIDLNTIENGFGNDYGTLSDKYIGLKLSIDGEDHFGWIQFSSTDSDPGSPLYYSDLELTLQSFAYNKGCAAVVTN